MNPETKNIPNKPCFLGKHSQNSTRRFFAQPRSHMGTQEKLRVIRRHTLQAICQVIKVVVKYHRGQKQLKKKSSTTKEYLGQTTYLRPNAPWSALNCFSKQSGGHHETQFASIVCATEWKVFGRVDKRQGNLFFFAIFGNKSMRKVRSQSKLASKLTGLHIA